VTSPDREKVIGIASPPRNVTITMVTSTSLELEWVEPADSGDGTRTGILDQLTYNVTATGSSDSSGCLKTVNIYDGTNKTTALLSNLCKGTIYDIDVVALNLMGPSEAAEEKGRPISPPGIPYQLDIIFNPRHWWNVTGNTMADVVWDTPLDTGDLGGGVEIERYRVFRSLPTASGGPVQDSDNSTVYTVDLTTVPGYSTMKTFAYNVSAVNRQGRTLGVFSAEGPQAFVQKELGLPPKVSVTTDDGITRSPPQAQGISDYCKQNCTMISCGASCTEEICMVVDEPCDNPGGGAGCNLCEDPVVKIFIGERNLFQIVAEDLQGGDSPSNVIDIVPPAAADLNPLFRPEGVVVIESETYPESTIANVSIEATPEMGRSGEDQRVCFFAVTEQGLRSRLCVLVRVIQPFPEFIEPYTREHQLTLGCQFSTLMTAIDYTEVSLDKSWASEREAISISPVLH